MMRGVGATNRIRGLPMLDNKGTVPREPVSGLMEQTPADDRRAGKRHIAVFRVGKLVSSFGQEFCLVRNISAGGLMANIYSTHSVGEAVAFELKAGAVVNGRIVWSRENRIGVAFDEPIDVDAVLASPQGESEVQARLPRIELHRPARLRKGARYHRVEVCDISQGGVKVAIEDELNVGDAVVLSLEGLPPQAGTVRWVGDGRAGISFNTAIPFGQIAAWTTSLS